MKLCITAAGNDLSATTDSSFGRAPWFFVVDTVSGDIDPFENAAVNVSQGAGIAAAQAMADKNVQAVLTGKLGPKAQTALSAAGIKMYEGVVQVTVGQALDQFNHGLYSESNSQAAGYAAGGGCGQGNGMGGGRRKGGGGAGMGRGQGRAGRNKK